MTGPLFLIGGHEDREGERAVLRAVARTCHGGPLALLTSASRAPERYVPVYRAAFEPLGIEVIELGIHDRAAADHPTNLALLDSAGAVFISGGGQVRAGDILRGTGAARHLRDRWEQGMPMAGTSAGAALLGEWMLGGGPNDEAPDDSIEVVRGLGFAPNTLVDQHLSQRGRVPRLIAASAIRGVVGIGVDEDTAAVVQNGTLDVVGSGSVTLVDATHATARQDDTGVSVRDARVSVLIPSDEPVELPHV